MCFNGGRRMKKAINRDILQIAVPSIVSNITVPLLGLVDVSIVGHLGAASYIGAIAVGGMLFSMIYWVFGFLRMGTGGLTAQAYGQQDLAEATRILLRSVGLSLLLAVTLIVLQTPIRLAAFHFMEASTEVEQLATRYFHICIWGAPATLGLYSFIGWFIGMQNSRYPMLIAILQNLVNIGASLFFVFQLHLKVEGVALGTLTAQYAGLLLAIGLWAHRYSHLRSCCRLAGLLERGVMMRFFKVNRDIFLRTLCLVAVNVWFTSTGAAYGDTLLAVNTLLMQLFTLFSYIMDGFAYAGEALSGKQWGSGDRAALHATVRHLFGWGIGLAVGFTLLYAACGKGFLALLTDNGTVIAASGAYFYWVLAIPLCGFAAFLFDGICIGITATGIMLKSSSAAAAAFFLLYFGLHPALGNHALWMAYISYLALRALLQGFCLLKDSDTFKTIS